MLLLVDGCARGGGAIHLYQPSTEHLINVYQVLVRNSTCGVHFHAWKYESSLNTKSSIPPAGSGSLARLASSDDISSFGASGNYRLYNASVPMIEVVGCTNISLMGMVRKGAYNEPKRGIKWLTDDNDGNGAPLAIGGYKALLLFRSLKTDDDTGLGFPPRAQLKVGVGCQGGGKGGHPLG